MERCTKTHSFDIYYWILLNGGRGGKATDIAQKITYHFTIFGQDCSLKKKISQLPVRQQLVGAKQQLTFNVKNISAILYIHRKEDKHWF